MLRSWLCILVLWHTCSQIPLMVVFAQNIFLSQM
uniref:Uncharacterized protein n=1 Tax=Rhizophora mucronata TaxID=61149 RepID=A0A2P2R2M0_RHIMU